MSLAPGLRRAFLRPRFVAAAIGGAIPKSACWWRDMLHGSVVGTYAIDLLQNLQFRRLMARQFGHISISGRGRSKEITLAAIRDVRMKPASAPSRCSVRAAISVLLRHGDVSVQCAARRLGMSVRSLQRYLAEMGTSYSELVAEVRLDTACRLLAESNERISDIALRVGYTGASSFSRSFARLMKMPPVVYRQQSAQGSDEVRVNSSRRAKWSR